MCGKKNNQRAIRVPEARTHQYSNCPKSHSGDVTIASFYKMAQDAGVDI